MGDALPPDVAAAAADPSSRVGHYVRVRKIGAGGFGEVWKAWDTALGRWVGLKFILQSDRDDLARFKREAETAAQLAHPNIAAVYEARDNFIAMQFVDGQTLGRLPRRNPRALVRIFVQAVRAVAHAHEHGVIHRDLKPDNIMVEDAAGTRPRVFVMDFGLAKRVSVDRSLTVSGMLLGTPAYMSPEQAGGNVRDIDARSDVYSLGATLYELIAGRPALAADSLVALLTKIVSEEPAPPPGDRTLATITLKCLEKDPARRYPSAAALADDLQRWLDGEPILARPPSVPYRLLAHLRKRLLVACLAAGLALSATAAVVFLPRLVGARRDVAAVRESLADAELFLALERELDILRMNIYKPEFRLTDDVQSRYEKLVSDIGARMRETDDKAYGHYLIGRCWEAAERKDEADAAYDAALRLDPDHAPSLMHKGRLYIERALIRDATKPYLDARALEETRAAEHYIRRGLAGATEASLDGDLARDYVSAMVALIRGEQSYSSERMMRKWAGAPFVEEFLLLEGIVTGEPRPLNGAVERMPSCARAYLWRGIARAKSQPEDALDDYTRALHINPRCAEAHLNRGELQKKKREFDAAIADFSRAIEIDPKCVAARVNRANVYRSRGDPDAAIAEHSRTLEIDPRCAAALINRGKARRDKGDVEGALEDCSRAIELSPDAAVAWTDRGDIRRMQGDHRGAEQDLARAIELDPDGPDAPYSERGSARHEQGDLEGALADYDRAIAQGRRTDVAYDHRGVIRAARGDLAGAFVDHTRALEIDPERAVAWSNRGIVRYHQGRLDDAIADYTRAIEIDPRFASAFSHRSAARLDRDEIAGAIADATRAIEIDDRHAAAYNHRGQARQRGGDEKGAEADYARCLALDPRCAAAYLNRSTLRTARGRLDEAIADLTLAIEADPRYADAYAYRGDARRLKGDAAGAIADMRKALALASSDWSLRKAVAHNLQTLENEK